MKLTHPQEDTMRTLKTITSHSGLARFYSGVYGAVQESGWVRRLPVPTPYASGPTHAVYTWRSQSVIIAETAHRRYEIIRVPSDALIFPREAEALADFVNTRKETP